MRMCTIKPRPLASYASSSALFSPLYSTVYLATAALICSVSASSMSSGELTYDPNKVVRDRPVFSSFHPLIPKHYVPEWQLDMKNRRLIIQVQVARSCQVQWMCWSNTGSVCVCRMQSKPRIKYGRDMSLIS